MKKILLVLLIISSQFKVKSQNVNGWDKAMNFGGAGGSVVDMRYDASGNLYFFATIIGKNVFAGQQLDPGATNNVPANESIYGKIAADGTQTLLKRFTTLSSIGRLDANCNLYLVVALGYPSAPVDLGNGIINGSLGAKIIKINNTGTAQWIKPIDFGTDPIYGTNGIAIPNIQGLQINSQGNIYVAAASNNKITDVNSPNLNKYPSRIIKLDSNGDEIWHYEMLGAGYLSDAANMDLPRQFVDDAGNVNIVVKSSADLKFNNESIAANGIGIGGLKNWFFALDNNGSKKWILSQQFIPTIKAVDPVTGEIYLNYKANALPLAAPFNTLPNAVASGYQYTGLLKFNAAGSLVFNKPFAQFKEFDNLFIAQNKLNFYGDVAGGVKFVVGENHIVYNASTTQGVVAQTDKNFNDGFIMKAPAKFIADYQGKISVSGEFKTPLTLGSTTLTPSYNDPDFASRFPAYASIKADFYIAQFDVNSVPQIEATTWLGNNTNWNDISNWSNGIPTGEKKAVIGAVAIMPSTFASPTSGNLVIGAGADLTLPSTLTLIGKLVNNGKITLDNAGFFQGFGASEISGSGEFLISGSTFLIYAGKFDNVLSFNNTITAASPLTVSSLNFIGANAKFSGNVFITNPNVNAISNQAGTPFIDGLLTRAVNNTGIYSFPVGSGTKAATVNFSANNLTGTSTIAVKYNATTPTGTTPNLVVKGSVINAVLNGGYWTITPDQQPISGNYALEVFLKASTNTVADPLKYLLIKRDNSASPWIFQGENTTTPTTVGNGATNVVTASLIEMTSFSDFAIGIGTTPITLPVTLTKFMGKVENQAALLFWETATELNNEKFIIERSLDGNKFISIGEVKGKENATPLTSYNFRDKNPSNGLNYYRLKQVDFDGKFEYSKELVALNFTLSTLNIKTYPNPVRDELYFIGTDGKKGTAVLYNLMGQKVQSTIISNEKISIDTQLPNGFYMLKATFNDGTNYSQKILINH